ncbi:GvpL/GvpF family gas vesicle protein [Streptomyces broussonetiae]|uniref:Gas vesicle protein n=1 Tax=Streptomyces broussonetiae TaxID=2686304 RepID=A0A6I6NLU1_9ACTN|nr:GvpL/GvpF family gas vesicle protein [Streptomyces broussonetiae]QHA09126.1 gas vesicle protein [Streptomyces broussonetiae]
MSTYVYGITTRAHPALPEGMAGVGEPPRPVRVLASGQLAAVVSDAPEQLRPKRRDLLAHRNVLAEAGSGGCVLPMRFGSVATDDDEVTQVLDERSDHYQERLRELNGKVEYNIKATHVEEAVLHLVMAENAEARDLAEANRLSGGGSYRERLRLGELVATAVKAREAEDATEVHDLLAPAADAVSVGPESRGWLVNVSFLVARDMAGDFLAAIEQVRKSHPHLDLRVNGPLPPYSFVEPGIAAPSSRAEGVDPDPR